MQHRSTLSFSRGARAGLGTVLLAALSSATACTEQPASNQVVDLSTGSPFVSVRKAFSPVHAAFDSPREAPNSAHERMLDGSAPRALASDVLNGAEADSDFYVAIKKSLLGERWFLSAYIKQFYPDNESIVGDQLFADTPLGTRVVSFKLQNGRLFVFDASNNNKQSGLQDPTVLIEAYPVVEQPEFSELPGSEDYVLFDPAQGLNHFAFTGAKYSNQFLAGAQPVDVGLSYLQNFHELADGAAFEQVFAGEAFFGEQKLSTSGTLGVALRRYQVGEHFAALPAPSTPFYFSNERFVSESGGQKASDANHWDFYPGMQPVEVFIGGGAQRAQADFPNVDVLGALQRGVEGWNDVFGFPVFQATFVEDDEIRDDDASFVLVDYPGAGNGTSRGHTRVNPDNGEILAANVYLGSGPFQGLELLGLQPLSAAAGAPAQPDAQTDAQPRLALSWSGMSGSSSVFEEDPLPTPAPEPMPAVSATREELAAGWIQAYLTHEMGHTLGLRHNFKGSLVAPASSVMDYAAVQDIFYTDTPGTYDVAAIRYLYGLSPDLPTQAFCTDEDTLSDPNCGRFDSGASPLYDYWAPMVAYEVDQVIDAKQPLTLIDGQELSQLLDFARDSDSTGFTAAVDRSNALGLALGRTLVPLDPELLADPEKVVAANAVAELVLRRSVLEPAGNNSAVPTDPSAIEFLSAEAGKMLRNEDGARSYALRRTAADVLWRLQSDAALLELRAAREALSEALQTSSDEDEAASIAEPALEQDLLDRVNARLTPYYQ